MYEKVLLKKKKKENLGWKEPLETFQSDLLLKTRP